MADEVAIDKQVFHDRLSSFLAAWKADKRSGDSVFNGVGSIVIAKGKPLRSGGYDKTAAFQVSFFLFLLAAAFSCKAVGSC